MRIVDNPLVFRLVVCALVAAVPPSIAGAAKNGCCYSVEENSICLDYSGSYWEQNPDAMRLNCQGPKVKFLAEHCPIDIPWDKSLIGSCIHGMEQPFETTAHHYNVGGGGYDAPDFDVDWLRITCQNVGGTWVWGRGSGRGIHGTP